MKLLRIFFEYIFLITCYEVRSKGANKYYKVKKSTEQLFDSHTWSYLMIQSFNFDILYTFCPVSSENFIAIRNRCSTFIIYLKFEKMIERKAESNFW